MSLLKSHNSIANPSVHIAGLSIAGTFMSLVDKKVFGITDYSDEITQLALHYQSVIGYMQKSFDSMVVTLEVATASLLNAEALMT